MASNTNMTSLTPLTITMVLQAQVVGGSYCHGANLVDGRLVTHVKIIGAVRDVLDVPHSSEDKVFRIEDGTGVIDAVTNGQSDVKDELRTRNHLYVVVYGWIIKHGTQTMCLVLEIHEMKDPNELTYHFLEVVFEGEKYQKARRAREEAAAAAAAAATARAGEGNGGDTAQALLDDPNAWPFDDDLTLTS